MSIPQPKRDEKGNVLGRFYPLQMEELFALRKLKVLTNAAYVHLALRYENPYCDRPIEIFPKEFALRWQMPESSVYEAIAKLKEINAIDIKYGKVVIEWKKNEPETIDTTEYSQQDSQQENLDSQQDKLSGNPESCQPVESRVSGLPEKILDSQKEKRIVRKDSGIPENAIYIDRARSLDFSGLNQTDQTIDVATTTEPTVEVEVFPPPPAVQTSAPETNQEIPHESEIQTEAISTQPEATQEDTFSAAADAEILREIERIAHNWKLRPWKSSAQHFKPEILKAVWQCNPGYYSLQGTQVPNQHHILKALQLLERQLKSLDAAAINAYHELMRYWQTAQALANPNVQHAFVTAAAQSKEQIEAMERKRQAQVDAERLRKDLGL